jgi:uncharacterized protein YrrD
MLHSAKKLDGMKIIAIDGDAGHVEDVYFDDEKWVIRHLQVDTGGWLTGRKVLVSPIAVSTTDWDDKSIHINLTKQQIEDGPGIETHKPVSRQHEEDIYRHFGYPYYWTGPYLWGYTVLPALVSENPLEDPQRQEIGAAMDNEGNEIHLRSCSEVIGYDIHATDKTIGHVDDFLFDDEDWSIRLMVVDTRNWWPGKHVLVPPQRVLRVSWEEKEVFVNVSRDDVENSPEYDESSPPSSDQFDLYRRTGGPPGGA